MTQIDVSLTPEEVALPGRAKRWVAGIMVKANSGLLEGLEIEQAMASAKAARESFAAGRPLDAGYLAVETVLAATLGVAKVSKVVSPVIGSAVSLVIPGDPIKMAGLAWAAGGSGYIALRMLHSGHVGLAAAKMAHGLGALAAGLGCLAVAAATGAALLTVTSPLLAPLIGVAAGLAVGHAASMGLGKIDEKIKASALAAGLDASGLKVIAAGGAEVKDEQRSAPAHKNAPMSVAAKLGLRRSAAAASTPAVAEARSALSLRIGSA